MKKLLILAIFLLTAASLLTGCSCESAQKENAVPVFTGFSSSEDLARFYLKTISEKDMEGLKSLFINQSDIKLLGLKKVNKQHVMSAFTHNKRLFLSKNKELLGTNLKFLSFRPGVEIKVNPDVSVFRGAQILAEKADGQRVALEINFLIRTKNYWKVLLLRYIRPQANVGQGPSVTNNDENKTPSMKVPGDPPKMEIKVTKPAPKSGKPDGKTETPESNSGAESIGDLEKLFTQ